MLTKRQKQILEYLKKFIKEKDYSPSLEDIRKHFRLSSKSTVHQHLETLKERGYISKTQNLARSIELPGKKKQGGLVSIPLLGTIAAGEPIEALENKETIAVSQKRLPLTNRKSIYALRVMGDSMVEENINDGDIILVRQQNTAENGQKVVALVDNSEATLKTFYKERGHIRLQPANKKLEPIIIRSGEREFAIQGTVIDVIKSEQQKKSDDGTKRKHEKHSSIKGFLDTVYHGDVMELFKQIPDNSVDTIFGDPDYNVGIKYEGKSYTRNFKEYIEWYVELTREALRVLKKDGNLFMLNYPKQNAYLWANYLDKYYPYVSEYVWVYRTNIGHTPKRFTTAHRTILHIRKSKDNKFYKDNVALPYHNPTDKRILQNLANGSKGRMPYSWFEFNLVKNVSREKTYHACQIPQKLTETLIKATTIPGDIVFTLFGGSGAEVEVTKKLGRHYITAEIDAKYYKLIMDRLEKGYISEEYKLKNGKRTPWQSSVRKEGLSSLPS